jgi:hypothetical protein
MKKQRGQDGYEERSIRMDNCDTIWIIDRAWTGAGTKPWNCEGTKDAKEE